MSEFVEQVRDALSRMKQGEASEEVLSIIVSAAEQVATFVPEFVFKHHGTGAYFMTQNDMLAETMHLARPQERMLVRYTAPLPPWEQVPARFNVTERKAE